MMGSRLIEFAKSVLRVLKIINKLINEAGIFLFSAYQLWRWWKKEPPEVVDVSFQAFCVKKGSELENKGYMLIESGNTTAMSLYQR
jgi:hypothetical protein